MAGLIPMSNFNPNLGLFKRCVQCPPVAPSCPPCKATESCITTIGDCNSCAVARCVPLSESGSTSTSNPSANTGPNVAAIAGGVVGGVVGVAILVFLVWKFWLNGRRREIVEYPWDEDLPPEEKSDGRSTFMQMRDARSSTHTVASLASTVLTRASNIIQIAYIPGVTNRGTNSPALLVPPVPPIPIPTTPSTVSSQFDGEQRYFVPELRGSTYSDASSITGGNLRKSIASSLARSSIATTIYKDDAVAHPMPATTILRGNAKVVSVKSGSSTVSPSDTPRFERGEVSRQPSSASTATSRPVIVKMLGSSDSLRASPWGSQKSISTMTGKSVKPVALNILRKGSKAGSSGASSGLDTVETASRSDQDDTKSISTLELQTSVEPSRQPLTTIHSRPQTHISLADSIATDVTSSHSRARASVARSQHDDEDESSDEEDPHERSRQSLLNGKSRAAAGHVDVSPFDDCSPADSPVDSPVDGPGKSAVSLLKHVHRERSPFDDDNAL